jgi:hypothetical protein
MDNLDNIPSCLLTIITRRGYKNLDNRHLKANIEVRDYKNPDNLHLEVNLARVQWKDLLRE